MRKSIYKNDIIHVLQKNHLLSISDINKNIPEADYSTVFRNVQILLEEKILKQILVNNKKVLYELSDHYHNHFICDTCGDVDEIEINIKNILKHKKINDIIVHGICNKCDI